MGRKVTDRTGHVYGRLTVVSFSHQCEKKQAFWNCMCSCGNISVVRGAGLHAGKTKSCGCHSASFKHGRSKTSCFKIWSGMLNRCKNKNNHAYADYGGRGITVCSRWDCSEGFKNFMSDMGERPAGKSLDRINNNGNYEPDNCCWSDSKQQARNRRSNTLVEWNGKTQSLAQWADDVGIKYSVLIHRHQRKWPVEQIMSQPARKRD